ncbi:MAG: phosphotransferase [Sphingobacteriales bacterium]|nr:phosphotransferase [Sphingobacteriales bacterium]
MLISPLDFGLQQLFQQWSNSPLLKAVALPSSGSPRRYFRIFAENGTHVLGVINADHRENKAYITMTEHFNAQGLPVPHIFACAPDASAYLVEDLGDTSLYSLLTASKQQNGAAFTDDFIPLYEQVLRSLITIQRKAAEKLPDSAYYPKSCFDRQAILWDLNYFKYYFLKFAHIPFDEQALENDFERFADWLLEGDNDYFVHRDFQSRNIMLFNNEPYFIDYQGGRKGALQYDVASLLFQAKAEIPEHTRARLLDFYIAEMQQYLPLDTASFKKRYYGYVYFRLFQTLGAYGLRGLFERKSHFLQSIPPALDNLAWLLQQVPLEHTFPTLQKVLEQLAADKVLRKMGVAEPPASALCVSIYSFSYKRGIPDDPSGNGGGFVFDCRSILNPGRKAEYRHFTGKDTCVIEYLERECSVEEFLQPVFRLVDQSAQNYMARGFSNLMVCFGCTGGQHRSVYCADRLAQHLQNKFNLAVRVQHIEQEIKNWVN